MTLPPGPPGGVWDVAVVGAGPAGAAAALGVLAEDPGASVVLLDRADFPRDKVCGDGVAPHALDVLAAVGAPGLLDDWPEAAVLRLGLPGGPSAQERVDRPGWVVPRAVLDARILAAALDRGAELRRARVCVLAQDSAGVVLDDGTRARVVVGADGAHSAVRRALAPAVPAQRAGTTAIALRAYAPVLPQHADAQVLAFSATGPRPCYAWSFAIGDGRANVGYGELLPGARGSGGAAARATGALPTRAHLLARLEELLPGAAVGAVDVAGHPLPLSTGRSGVWAHGRVLLAGDAASLVNPITGEGIYYAAMSGALAGRAAVRSLLRDGGAGAGALYQRELRRQLAVHLVSTDVAERLVRSTTLLEAALRACAGDRAVFTEVSDMGLARGRLTGRVVTALGRELGRELARGAGRALHRGARGRGPVPAPRPEPVVDLTARRADAVIELTALEGDAAAHAGPVAGGAHDPR